MNRILNLQVLSIATNFSDVEGGSTSSDHNCACSTNSAVACFTGDELIAI
jgi:hypothetical protein